MFYCGGKRVERVMQGGEGEGDGDDDERWRYEMMVGGSVVLL